MHETDPLRTECNRLMQGNWQQYVRRLRMMRRRRTTHGYVELWKIGKGRGWKIIVLDHNNEPVFVERHDRWLGVNSAKWHWRYYTQTDH